MDNIETDNIVSEIEAPEGSKKGIKLTTVKVVGTITALILLSILVYFNTNVSNFFGTQKAEESFSLVPDTLYLTAKAIDGNRLDVFSYNVNEKVRRELVPLVKKRNMTASLSPNGELLVFSSKALGLGGFAQLYIKKEGEEGKHITHSDTYLKIHPRFSPDNETLVYMARTDLGSDELIPNNWEIYTSDLDGNESLITEGVYSFFSPNGDSVVVLKTDGLYTVDLSTKIPELVWSIKDGIVLVPMSFSVSDDKQKLAWTNPYDGIISIFSIISWNPFVMELDKEIETTALYTVFSQDNKFLAVQEVEWDKDTHKPSNTKIVVHELSSQEAKEVLDLSDEDLQERIILTDWR